MFKMMYSLLLLMTLVTHSGCLSGKGTIDIVSDGASKYVIVLPADATRNEIKAGKVLQDYLKRISGASLKIINETSYHDQPGIFIGNTDHATDANDSKLKAEAFLLVTDNKNLYIRGGSGKGVLYGVYTLLENYFGCRKYAAGPTFVPSHKTLQLPQQLTDRQEPAFIYREVYYPAAFDDEYLEWHKLHRLEDLWGVWAHSYFKMLPPETYFATHPAYYALLNGKRQATQLCVSNDEVFRITVEYLRTSMATHPDALYWSISPEDGAGFCQCPQCTKANQEEGGPQGPLIRFVNRIATAFPDKQFTTLAYLYTSHPPLKTKPAPNVYVMLSTINASREQPLRTNPTAAAFRKDLAGWKALTDKIFIWDYTTQFTNFLAPFPDYSNLNDNLQYFADENVKGVFSQGSADSYSDMAPYNCYLQAKLLWNTKQPPETITNDFLTGYYGKAGPFIGQYMKALEANVKSTKTSLGIYDNPVNNYKNYLSPEAIDAYSNLLDKAEKAVEDDTVLLNRVYAARLPLEYTVLQQSRFYGTEKNGYLIASEGSYIVHPRWPQRVKRFVAISKQAGVKELSEGGINPDVYASQWDSLFTQKWVNSLAFGAKVSLVNPWSEDYPAKKERTLTDGLTGNKDFAINWLFIYGKDLIATIDMGAAKTVKEVKMNFLQDPRHGIFNPADIIVEVSTDGKNFSTAGKQQLPALQEGDFTVGPVNYRFQFPATQARYIRVTGHCLPATPAWTNAADGKKPAVCCDEIFVL
jgi:hypothetical protein